MTGKCFVLMPFKDPFNDYHKQILVPAIETAGFQPSRVDEIYGTRPIIEDIFKEVREASALIADVTGKNSNVNYELGIAHAIERPVVIISQSVDDIPFDLETLKQYNFSILVSAKIKDDYPQSLKLVKSYKW